MKLSNLTFSVVIPVYITSVEKYNELVRCLDSILLQDLRPDYVLLSTDTPEWNMHDLIRQYSDINVKLIVNHGRPGIATNSNNALNSVDTKYVHVLHQDDFLLENNLYSRVINTIENSPNSWAIITNRNSNELSAEDFLARSSLLGFNILGGPSAVIMKANPVRFSEKYSMLVDVTFFEALKTGLGVPCLIDGKNLGYGDSLSRVSRTTPMINIRREISIAAADYNFDGTEIMEIIRNRNLDCYHRFQVWKALENSVDMDFVRKFIVRNLLRSQIILNKLNMKSWRMRTQSR
jgi:glycosyltransferase involved in cell wall biosynthesis